MYFCIQIATNGLVFTIFALFEAHTSIRHLSNDTYSTEGFVVKKKVRHMHIDGSSKAVFYILFMPLSYLYL